MANNSYEKQLKSLRDLVMRLTGEIDYKNLTLIDVEEKMAANSAEITVLIAQKKWLEQEMLNMIKEKERLSNERPAAIAVLIQQDAEKEKLLEEKSAVIADLIKEKEQMAKEMSNVRSKLEVKEEKMDSNLRELIVEKDRVIDEKSAVISKLMAEKDELFDSFLKELEKTKNMKLELENLHKDSECRKEEISTARKKLKVKEETNDHESSTINMLIQQNAQKDRLIAEKSTVISNLMAEKNHLFETYMRELEKTKRMKQNNEMLKHEMECQKYELKRLIKEKTEMDMEHENAAAEEPYSATKEFKDSKVQTEEEQNPSMEGTEQLELQVLEDLRAELNSLRQQLEEKEEAAQYLEDANKILMVKEVASNQELQAARSAAIEGFESMKKRRTLIGIKRIGDLDLKPFQNACKKRFCSGNWEDKLGNMEGKCIELLSSWERDLSNASWQPFKLEVVDGKQMEVIDENDPKLKELREEWGDEAYKEVTEALLGLNQYNASGRYPVSELWNFKQDRTATLGEVVQYVFKQWYAKKKKAY